MKSGLEGRNNSQWPEVVVAHNGVSMKSGLEGRNNRPQPASYSLELVVSMKSGLEGRNNERTVGLWSRHTDRLNEVRPRRPEQFGERLLCFWPVTFCLNEVRPRRPEQFCETRSEPPSNAGLNEVRPRRPEQLVRQRGLLGRGNLVSMKSGLEGRNNRVESAPVPLSRGCLNEVRPRRPEQ